MDKKTNQSFSIFTEKGLGSIEIAGDMLKIKDQKINSMKINYVTSLESKGSLPMGKVSVEMKYYDLFGNAENCAFAMRESNFAALKKALNL